MATINMTFTDVSTEEARAADHQLTKVNEERTAQGLAEYASVSDWLSQRILDELPSWIQEQSNDAMITDNAYTLWRDATDAQRNAAIAALTG